MKYLIQILVFLLLKVLYTGRSQALGIKQGEPSQGKWVELPITKSPKIVQISTGHEGQHALLVSEDGSLFFVGTPKRGEDGDASSCKFYDELESLLIFYTLISNVLNCHFNIKCHQLLKIKLINHGNIFLKNIHSIKYILFKSNVFVKIH